jgi:predicted extracellular nuclease
VVLGRFDAIAGQIVHNMGQPSVIALQEKQDNSGSVNDGSVSASETLEVLVEAIEAQGGPSYAWLNNTLIGDGLSGGQPGVNIRTALLYDPSTVSYVPGSVGTIDGQGTGEAFEDARLPLTAQFAFGEETYTFVNVHLSSGGGSAPIFGVEQDVATRQEDVTVNGSLDERQRQAEAVADHVAQLENVIVLGDFNEFEFVSPLQIIENAGLTNLTSLLPEDKRYYFIFQGNSPSPDHALVSDDLVSRADFDIVHVNSEFEETPERASDHDPLLASLSIPDEFAFV